MLTLLTSIQKHSIRISQTNQRLCLDWQILSRELQLQLTIINENSWIIISFILSRFLTIKLYSAIATRKDNLAHRLITESLKAQLPWGWCLLHFFGSVFLELPSAAGLSVVEMEAASLWVSSVNKALFSCLSSSACFLSLSFSWMIWQFFK